MKKLRYLLVFALSATLFLGCQEEEGASIYYPSKAPAFRLGDKIELPNKEEISEINYPGKELLTTPIYPGNSEMNGSVSAMLVLPRLPKGPRPKPCICDPLPRIIIEEPYRFDPKFDYAIYVTDRQSGEIINKLTEFSMDEDLQSVYFGSSVEDLLVPSGATALSISTSIIVDGEPIAANFQVNINPETLPGY